MPWVRLGDPVTVGPVVFFDYPSETIPVTLTASDRAQLGRLKALCRTWPEQDEVKSIVVAAIDPSAPLRPINDEERDLVRRAGYALAFACLAHGYHAPFAGCSADNFRLFHQLRRIAGDGRPDRPQADGLQRRPAYALRMRPMDAIRAGPDTTRQGLHLAAERADRARR